MDMVLPPRGRKQAWGRSFSCTAKYFGMYPVGLQRKDAANQEEEKAPSRKQLVLSLVGEPGASQMEVGRQDALDQGLADYSPQAKSGLLSDFQNKNLWEHSHIYLFMNCVCICAVMAELSSCDRDHMAPIA